MSTKIVEIRATAIVKMPRGHAVDSPGWRVYLQPKHGARRVTFGRSFVVAGWDQGSIRVRLEIGEDETVVRVTYNGIGQSFGVDNLVGEHGRRES